MHNEIGLARLPDVNWSSKIARQFMSQHINEYVAICNDMYLPYRYLNTEHLTTGSIFYWTSPSVRIVILCNYKISFWVSMFYCLLNIMHERLFLGTFQDQLKWLNFIWELKKFYWLNFMDWLLDSKYAVGTYEFWVFLVKIFLLSLIVVN